MLVIAFFLLYNISLVVMKMYKYYDNLEDYKIAVKDNEVASDYYFPKGFFITPNGYLYNTSKSNGHRYNGFVDEFIFLTDFLKKNKSLPDLSADIEYFKNKLDMIKDLKYVDYKSAISWMDRIYELPSNISLDIGDTKKITNNQMIIAQLYKGYCDAYIEFYKFFLENFNENIYKRYESIDNILGSVNPYDKMVEILVRCIGFHKIELHNNNRNITTSSLHPVSDFYDYLMNDYNVWVVPKIVDNGVFQEINLNYSIPISSFTAIEDYEFENPDKGKIRILGL